MVASILAILAGLIPLVLSIVEAMQVRKDVAHEKAVRLAAIEADQTDDAMAAVDRQLDGVQPDQRESVLLSPDDHL